jgi:CRISPR-associated protein Csb1
MYEGGRYQHDRRWPDQAADEPSDVIVIDNVPSQANRIEASLSEQSRVLGVPEMVLDLTGMEFAHLPSHLPRSLSSWRWPHRHADAYLIDSLIDGEPAYRHSLGRALLSATPDNADVLVSWFPQSLLFGFWQSHQGKKRAQTKHARAWISEIIGWCPAFGRHEDSGSPRVGKILGTKGDPYNLNIDNRIKQNENDRFAGWQSESSKPPGRSNKEKLSSLGHGQVPFRISEASPAGVSFQTISQLAIVSFAQLRKIRVKSGGQDRNTAARTLLVALGLHGQRLAFERAFHLRSGADLRPIRSSVTWLGKDSDREIGLGDTAALLTEAKEEAQAQGVALSGWDEDPILLQPNNSLRKVILDTWPDLDGKGR